MLHPNPCTLVRETTACVLSAAKHVSVSRDAVRRLASQWAEIGRKELFSEKVGWTGCGYHYSKDAQPAERAPGPLTAQYVAVLDCLNFCFWPCPGMEYEHLALGLKAALEEDPRSLDGTRLAKITEEDIKKWVPGFDIPLLQERVRLVRELGCALVHKYGGEASGLIAAAENSAARLVQLVLELLPGFRDEALYNICGRVHFYKRAQIFVADIWAAYGQQDGKDSPYGFYDMEELTMFADYRVPQSLIQAEILIYSPELLKKISEMQELAAGCEEEIEIRAVTVQAVEMLREDLRDVGLKLLSVEVDWLLWHMGEEIKDEVKFPFHRCRTHFY